MKEIQWVNNEVPRDEPDCGFQGEHCSKANYKHVILYLSCGSLMMVALVFIIRSVLFVCLVFLLMFDVEIAF